MDDAPGPATEVLTTMYLNVEGINHEVLASLHDEDDMFARLCRRIHADPTVDWRVLNIVDPYSDTMLNRVQQVLLRRELETLRQRPDLLEDAGPLVDQIGAALERVLAEGGYLTFVGE